MLKKLFGTRGTASAPAAAPAPAVAAAPPPAPRPAQPRPGAEGGRADPLAGARVGSKEVNQRLMSAMKSELGVHIESLLCALGAVAGYSCQASLRAVAVSQGLPESGFLKRVEAKDGKTYFFGDRLNQPLAESRYSIWSVAGGGAQQAGCARMPDIAEMFRYASSTLGTSAFGLPRYPEGHQAQDTPINYVRALWPRLRPTVSRFCPDPEYWPVLLALSIQETIVKGKGVLDPCIALRLVMESAIPMSKVDLEAT